MCNLITLLFFNRTPIGRIINRFSKDMYTVDEQLIVSGRSYLATMMSVLSTILVVASVTPVFILGLAPVVVFYLHQQSFFTMTYRELKRLDSVTRSPIYALLGETLDGVLTIRAFNAQDTLNDRMVSMLNIQQTAYHLTFSAQCWLSVRLEFAGTMIVMFTCLVSVLEHGVRGGDEIFAGLAGLSISFALGVTQSLNWTVRMASDLEANMVAVERIQQYFNIKGEAPRLTPADDSLPANWPTRGRIEFIDAMMRYRPGLPLVLKGLTLNIPAQSKVGVVGRTGEFCGVYFGSGLDKSFLSDSSCFPAIKVLGKVHLWLLYFVSWS
jgi:ATP-binding cassette subfamily C (CFTR/MRP) protein 1